MDLDALDELTISMISTVDKTKTTLKIDMRVKSKSVHIVINNNKARSNILQVLTTWRGMICHLRYHFTSFSL
jgi:hypothetical protein